ncbi:hypothetical protein FBU31_002954 [Coemansia sp. 'formosensis']|nr:hypothetical protein FBU31_002954 [Coemansia sp. 'formosensis']
MRKRMAERLGISLKPTSILDHDNDSRSSNSDNDDDSYGNAGRSRADAPLFAGIEDPPVAAGFGDEDDSEFEDAGSQQGIPGDDDNDNGDAGSGESEQWGEDDEDDDDNFDDLINNLEEEISST